MTENKPIMIDVNKCKYRDKCTNFCLAERNEIGDTYTICTGTNCYFKKLARKTKECEELKDKLNCCFCNPYVELNDFEKQRKCVEVTECFRRQLDQLKVENKQLYLYKQAVRDIKKIAEKIDDSDGCAYGDYDCDNCSSLEQETVCTYKVKKLIIQKCEEVDE